MYFLEAYCSMHAPKRGLLQGTARHPFDHSVAPSRSPSSLLWSLDSANICSWAQPMPKTLHPVSLPPTLPHAASPTPRSKVNASCRLREAQRESAAVQQSLLYAEDSEVQQQTQANTGILSLTKPAESLHTPRLSGTCLCREWALQGRLLTSVPLSASTAVCVAPVFPVCWSPSSQLLLPILCNLQKKKAPNSYCEFNLWLEYLCRSCNTLS